MYFELQEYNVQSLGVVMPPRDSIENLFFSKLDLLRHVGEAIMWKEPLLYTNICLVGSLFALGLKTDGATAQMWVECRQNQVFVLSVS